MQEAAQGPPRGIRGPFEGFQHRGLGATVEDSRKFGCPAKFVGVIKSFHDGMNASVSAAG